MDVKTIREGGNNAAQIRLFGAVNYGTLTLKRGMTANFDLWNWFNTLYQPDKALTRGQATVVVFAADGTTERVRFLLENCLPQKLKAPPLNAREGTIAIEEMQLAYEIDEPQTPCLSHARACTTPKSAAHRDGARPQGQGAGRRAGERAVQPGDVEGHLRKPGRLGPKNKGAQVGTAALQHVGKGTTKLAVQLWFDVNHPIAGATPSDVREMTGQVTYFITPNNKQDPAKYIVPAVKFLWGRFSFVGVMEALEETLDLFSNDGRPLAREPFLHA